MRVVDLPPVWLLGCLAVAWAQAEVAPVVGFGATGQVLGGALIALAVVLMAAAAFEFLRHRTTIVPHEMPRAMIARGVYRISRNPIYLADALLLAGFSLRWDSLLGLLLVPVFIRLITRRFILGEEARLEEKFGSDFETYTTQVRRWL